LKKKGHNKNSHLLILLGILLIAGLFLFDTVTKNNKINNDRESQSTISPTPSLKTYHSDFLEATIQIPHNYSAEENFTNTITISTRTGHIKVERLYTNAESIRQYLAEYDARRTLEVINEENLKINGYDSVVRVQMFNGGPIEKNKIYFIYADGLVYAISTAFEDLYSDLDQIANSFRYDP
jgi:hypothetical protein